MALRLLIVSSCTGLKRFKPANGLSLSDFRGGEAHLRAREAELAAYQLPARELYTGNQHREARAGVDLLAAAGVNVAFKIVSAGYGLVDQHDVLAPYETTFGDLGAREADDWAGQLRISQALNAALAQADLAVFLLGENYLRAAGLPLDTRPDQALVWLTSAAQARKLPAHAARQAVLGLGNAEARRYGYGSVGLKGFLLRKLAQLAAAAPETLARWHAEPASALRDLDEFVTTKGRTRLLAPPLEAGAGTFVPGIHRVNLGYNPDHLDASAFYPPPPAPEERPRTRFTVVLNNRDRLRVGDERKQLWHFFEEAPRGFLTSLANHRTFHGHLKESLEGNIFDCGAWTYKNEAEPILKGQLLTAERSLALFEAAGAGPRDLVVSPDMLVFDADDAETRARKLCTTLACAREFLPLAVGHRPVAVTHGDLAERRAMMRAYLEMGYTHVALGSLAMKSSTKPQFVLEVVRDALRFRGEVPDLYIHVLGVSSIPWAATLTRLGVNSFDGSSMYLQAFTAGAFLRYDPQHPRLLHKYRVVDNAPWSGELPACPCPACAAVRAAGFDTRAQGGKPGDPTGRPYNGGHEANMGRAAHNINMYLRALRDVQGRVLRSEEPLALEYTSGERPVTAPQRELALF